MLGHATDGAFDAWAATRALSLRVEPDFLLLMPPDWTLAWASVCFPSRWSLRRKTQPPTARNPFARARIERGTGDEDRHVLCAHEFRRRLGPRELGTQRIGGSQPASNAAPFPCSRRTATAGENVCPGRRSTPAEAAHTGAMAFGIRVLSFRLTDIGSDTQVRAGLRTNSRPCRQKQPSTKV